MKSLNIVSLILIVIITAFSCKPEAKAPTKSSLELAKEAMEYEAKDENINKYLTEIRTAIKANNSDQKALLMEGQRTCETYRKGGDLVGFLMPLVKEYPNDALYSDRLAKLSSVLFDMGQKDAAEILAMAYFERFPEGKYLNSLKEKAGDLNGNVKDKLKSLAENVFKDPNSVGINKKNAQHYVDGCEAYALGYPTSEDAPTYLYKGAEIARTLRSYAKALSIFDWIIEQYPNAEKAPTTLFLKGFMLDSELNDKAKAREAYNLFLSKYPNDELADDVKFLMENMDKSDKEILKMIEEQK